MRISTLAVLIGLALPGAAVAAAPEMNPPARRSTDLPPPRDPDVAVRQQFEAARRAGTAAAYDLFIARNSDHDLAKVARRERARLATSPRR